MGVIGPTQEVIRIDTVEIGKFVNNFLGDQLHSRLHVAIFALRDADGLGDLPLGEVVIAPQLLETVSHHTITRK